jgi:two-component system, OmpR family, phosphate regulon sensor histidine kinase PhoR
VINGRQLRSIMLGAGLVLVILALFEAPRWLTALAGAGLFVLGAAALLNQTRRPPVPVGVETGESFPQRLAAILDAVPSPTIVLDRRGVVLNANQSAQLAFPTLRVDAPLSFAMRNPQLLQLVDQALTRQEPGEMELSERVPLERSFLIQIEPLEGNEREAAVVSLQDTTSMRRTEQMRVDFVANASHELRTPLASIMGFVETLQGAARNDPAARDRFLGIMAQQGRRMARLIEDLLSLSRIELSAHILPDEIIDLADLLRGVSDGLSALAYDRGVRLVTDAVPEAPLRVRGAKDELIRVFENLIENAIKYGQSGGRVDIALRPPGAGEKDAVVSVRDHGPGIAPEHLPRLTERFYRVDIGASRDKGGTGLGLAIVKHILNRHRGRLQIESEAGNGATFSVHLPVLTNSD